MTTAALFTHLSARAQSFAVLFGVILCALLAPGAAMASTGCASLNFSGTTTGSGTFVGPSPSGNYAAGDILIYTVSLSGGTGYQQLNSSYASNISGHVQSGTYYISIPSSGSFTFTAVDGSPVGNGGSETINFTLTCVSAQVPTITGVNPNSGYNNGSTSVAITGTHFIENGATATEVTSVKFGTVAASFTVHSATSITAIAPTGSTGTVDITVSNSTYTSATSSNDHFTYTGPAPVPNCLPYDTTARVPEVIDFSTVGNSATLTKDFYNTNGATNCETQDFGLYTSADSGGSANVASIGYSDAADSIPQATTITGAGGSSITFTGQTGASDYDLLTVKVANSAGLTTDTYTVYTTTDESTVNSSIKFVVNFAAVATVPGAPTIGTATAGNASASVTFTAPSSNGGAAITGYTVTSSPGGLSGTGTSSPITVSGLTNGTAYTFTVKATNSVGTGGASGASNSVTPSTVPGAPTIGTATAGNAQASVTFTAPSSNGGAAITSYTVTSSPGGFTATGTGSPIVVTGLTNGTAYTFTVAATNVSGKGASSAASNSVTPVAPPVAGAVATSVIVNSTNNAIPLNLSGGAATSVAVATAAAHGTATATGTAISYTPTANYSGADSFTYTATNGSGTSTPGTVSISVNFGTPTVTSISPNTGTNAGGTGVTISGTQFAPGSTVSIGGVAATNTVVVSTTSITATTPAYASGALAKDVVVNNGVASATLSGGFTYSSVTPTVTFVPSSSLTYSGLTLTSAVLDATSSTAGTFAYTATLTAGSPVAVTANTVLAPGVYTLTANFTPMNSGVYSDASATAPFTVVIEHVWVAYNSGSVSAVDAAGNPVVGTSSGGQRSLAIDASGDVWSINASGSTMSEFSNTGVLLNGGISGGGLNSGSNSLAIDGDGYVWVANSGNSISVFDNTGAARSPATTGLIGGTGGNLSSPTGVAIDISGSVWISNSANNTVTRFLGAAAPVAPLANAVTNNTLGVKP